MVNSVIARFNDNCKVHVAMSDDTTVTKAVIIDADGNETDIGGGGGSSDFSTAVVAVFKTENPTNNYQEIEGIIIGTNAGEIRKGELNHGEYDIVLYKGLYVLYTNNDTFVSLTGNATYEVDEESGDVTISVTGDCSITLNPEQLG